MTMLAPILVALSAELHTSVAIAAQLSTVTSLVWGFSAIAIGPISDTYGRRRVLLTGLLLMCLTLIASAFAGSYGAMLVARIMTGLAAAMIPPTCYAICADQLSTSDASKAMAWTMVGGVLGGALGMSIVAWLANLGNWHTPFLVLAIVAMVLFAVVWAMFPGHVVAASHEKKSFLSHFREVGGGGNAFWLVLLVNFLLQSASWGTLSYLPAYLMQTYHLPMGEIAFPLLLNGLGVVVGALLGGRLATYARRSTIVIFALASAGILVAIAFSFPVSIWLTVGLTSLSGGMFFVSQPLLMTLLFGLAGAARGTASGFLALSTQIGAMCGAAIGGLLLSFGGYPQVGIGCFITGAIAAITMARAMRGVH